MSRVAQSKTHFPFFAFRIDKMAVWVGGFKVLSPKLWYFGIIKSNRMKYINISQTNSTTSKSFKKAANAQFQK